MSRRRSFQEDQSWSGFVDLFSNLTILLLFILMIFMLAQFFMSLQATHSKGKLAGLSAQMVKLTERVKQYEQEKEVLYEVLSSFKVKLDTYAKTVRKKEIHIADLQDSYAILHQKALFERRKSAKMEEDVKELNNLVAQLEGTIIEKDHAKKLTQEELQKQKRTLETEIQKLNSALDSSDKYIEEQEVQIVELSKRLNRALANKTMELHRYQSVFFKDLSKALGEDKAVRVKGDRFVIQSEVLFESGSSEIGKTGKDELVKVAEMILRFEKKLPKELPWIIRVDGHTDATPIKASTNWELSTRRAVAVVTALVSQGVDPHRLAATGFAEFQPVTEGKTSLERKYNRRIEFYLTRP
ncbi:MAG: OmpA family protein [Alphaproteobacteria bacterium]|nr:OmpA family protein [Alphaproteobacteria bacterium]